MKISELKAALSDIALQHGDLDVVTDGSEIKLVKVLLDEEGIQYCEIS